MGRIRQQGERAARTVCKKGYTAGASISRQLAGGAGGENEWLVQQSSKTSRGEGVRRRQVMAKLRWRAACAAQLLRVCGAQEKRAKRGEAGAEGWIAWNSCEACAKMRWARARSL